MNATVALSLNFNYQYLKPFLKSYAENVNGDLFLVTDLHPGQIEVKSNKFHFINFSELAQRYKVASLTPYNLKPVLFYLYLKELAKTSKYKTALLTDVDVVFQKDPFDEYVKRFDPADMVLSEERRLYSECDTNSIWYRQGYNETYSLVKDKKILNCGVTIGPIEGLIDYQKKVAAELSKVLARRNYFAYDQVILNHLTYVDKQLHFNVLAHLNDFIIHLSQAEEGAETYAIKDELVINTTTNAPYVILHQFDKRELLKPFIVKKYD